MSLWLLFMVCLVNDALGQNTTSRCPFLDFYIAMIAATFFLFFIAEAGTVSSNWKTSLQVGGVVTLVAGAHHMSMREYGLACTDSLVVHRYIKWSVAAPLQRSEFNPRLEGS